VLETELTIPNKWGLHARAAWLLAELSGRFASDVVIANENHQGNAKTVTEILLLAAEQGSRVTLRVEGEDEETAFREIETLIRKGFYESK
jgi:phosphocarrier protein